VSKGQTVVLPDAEAAARWLAEAVVEASRSAVAEKGAFRLLVSGGSTPAQLFRLLGEGPYRERLDWSRLWLYWADERFVPPGHAESNFGMLQRLLLSRVAVPAIQVCRWQPELGLAAAAEHYETVLRSDFGDDGPDLALLGVGADGHTASLFPGTAALQERRRLAAANFVPALAGWRLTVTRRFLERCGRTIFLVTGREKAAIIGRLVGSGRDERSLPASTVASEAREAVWVLDKASASLVR